MTFIEVTLCMVPIRLNRERMSNVVVTCLTQLLWMICKDCNNYYVMIMLIMIVGVFTETPRWGECCGLCGVCTLHQRSSWLHYRLEWHLEKRWFHLSDLYCIELYWCGAPPGEWNAKTMHRNKPWIFTGESCVSVSVCYCIPQCVRLIAGDWCLHVVD